MRKLQSTECCCKLTPPPPVSANIRLLLGWLLSTLPFPLKHWLISSAQWRDPATKPARPPAQSAHSPVNSFACNGSASGISFTAFLPPIPRSFHAHAQSE